MAMIFSFTTAVLAVSRVEYWESTISNNILLPHMSKEGRKKCSKENSQHAYCMLNVPAVNKSQSQISHSQI
jgi:hypothetical protein